MMPFVFGLILSLGAINALIPILIILILLVASAGLNRGYSLFNFFGLTTLAGINPGGKASIAGKQAFNFAAAFIYSRGFGKTVGAGKKALKRLNRFAGKKFSQRVGARLDQHRIKKAAKREKKSGVAQVSGATPGRATKWGKVKSAAGHVARTVAYKPVRQTAREVRAGRAANKAKNLGSNPRAVKRNPLSRAATAAVGGTKRAFNKAREHYPGARLAKRRSSRETDIGAAAPKVGMGKSTHKQFASATGFMMAPGLKLLSQGRKGIRNLVTKAQRATGGGPNPENDKLAQAGRRARAGMDEYVKSKGGVDNMTRADWRSARKAARQEIGKGYDEAHKRGSRTIVGAGVAGTLHLAQAAHSGAKGGGGLRGAAHSVGQQLRENVRTAGLKDTSIDSAKLLRRLAIINGPALSTLRSNSKDQIRASSITSERLSNMESEKANRAADRLLSLREMHIAQTRKPELLQEHIKLIDGEIAAIRQRMMSEGVAGVGAATAGERSRGPTFNQETIDKLNNLKAAAALNSRLPPDELNRLSNDESPMVRAAALRNKNLNMDDDEIGRRANAEKQRAHEALEEAEKQRQYMEVNKASMSEDAKRAAEARLSDLESNAKNTSRVFSSLAMNPKASAESLGTILSASPTSDVKVAVAKNPNSTNEMLAKMAADQDKTVRDTANAELKKRGSKPKPSGGPGGPSDLDVGQLTG